MKKSVIWLLTALMAIALGSLLYFQIMYLENMVKMRESQFSENVKRSLHSTVVSLERQETLYFLEQDINIMESTLSPSTISNSTLNINNTSDISRPGFQYRFENISERYKYLRETIRSQYLYQRGLLNEVILAILRDSGTRPVTERADSVMVRHMLKTELTANGLEVPFTFAVASPNGEIMYMTRGFNVDEKDIYAENLFPNTDNQYKLMVQFPTRHNYIFSSVRFVIPTLALTIILLVIFVYTIMLAFRQKKLTEMKADFINNMTHEFKTPISTISLAAQMLNDDTVTKSPTSLKHLSNVIIDESKRLRFQVEKVLQLSMFENAGGSLNFTVVDVNDIIFNVVQTHKLKVEKLGGDIEVALNAQKSDVYLDEMHFTNVIFNLLDNAIKYMKEDTAPHLRVTTSDISDDKIEIRVRDNGIGIKKEDIKRIFDKFYRVSTGNLHNVKGFGLGLAYVKKMVSVFGGKIEVISDPGKWSEFIITLPLVPESNLHPDETPES